jgi:hypothetical protein
MRVDGAVSRRSTTAEEERPVRAKNSLKLVRGVTAIHTASLSFARIYDLGLDDWFGGWGFEPREAP